MQFFFNNNIKLFRKRKGMTQDDLAHATGTTRSTINNYETGITPSVENMLVIADFFKINADTILRTDLSKLSEFNLSQLERGYDIYMRGTKLRVHATTIDEENNDNVELVTHKAKAGYISGYSDPDFISKLPTFHLPFLSKEKKFRTFQIEGDSMLPIPDKSFVITEFIQDWTTVKDETPCVLLTKEDGIIFKMVFNHIKKNRTFLLKSLNTKYEPYPINANEVVEMWRFVYYFSSEVPELFPQIDSIIQQLGELKEMAIKD